MIIKLKCPFCNASLDADIAGETEVGCPVCRQVFTVDSVDYQSQNTDDRLLDPADPAGYFNNFPAEDDF